MKSRRTQ